MWGKTEIFEIKDSWKSLINFKYKIKSLGKVPFLKCSSIVGITSSSTNSLQDFWTKSSSSEKNSEINKSIEDLIRKKIEEN